MHVMQWCQEMSLGVREMDEAHKAFLDELGRLANAESDLFIPAFMALIKTLEDDFREEEVLMARIDFPGARKHREQHERALSGLYRVVAGVREGDIELGRETLLHLPNWFLNHLSAMDLPLAIALELAGEHRHQPPPVFLRREISRMLNVLELE